MSSAPTYICEAGDRIAIWNDGTRMLLYRAAGDLREFRQSIAAVAREFRRRKRKDPATSYRRVIAGGGEPVAGYGTIGEVPAVEKREPA